MTPHSDCSRPAGCRPAWLTPPSNGWKSLWMKASHVNVNVKACASSNCRHHLFCQPLLQASGFVGWQWVVECWSDPPRPLVNGIMYWDLILSSLRPVLFPLCLSTLCVVVSCSVLPSLSPQPTRRRRRNVPRSRCPPTSSTPSMWALTPSQGSSL